jgi:hypothetical protein
MDLQQLLDALNHQTRKVNELRAENERLRGALDVIISIGRGEQGNCDSCLRMEQVAQAALDAAGE